MLKALVKDVFIYGIAGGLSKSLMILLLPIYTRIFTPDEYGIVDLVTTVLMFLTIMSMLQMEAAIGRYFYEAKDEHENRRNLSTAFWTIIGCSALLIALLFLAAKPLSSLLFDTDKYSNLFLVTAAILPVSNIYAFLTALMRYVKKPILYGVFSLIQIILTLGSSILFVVQMKLGIAGVFYGQLTGFAVAAAVMLLYSFRRKLLGLYWENAVIIRYLKFSLPLLPGMFSSWANNYVNRFVMLSYLTLAEIGIFTVAFRIASVFRILEDAVKMAWGPFLYQSLQKEDHRELFKTVFNYAVMVVFSLVIVLSLFADEIFSIFATAEYKEAIHVMIILFLTLGINTLVQIVLIGPVITKKTHYNSILQLTSLAVNIALLFIFVPKIGLIGVPLSLLCSTLTLFLLSWINTEKLYHVGYPKLVFIIALGTASSVVGISIYYNIDLTYRITIAVLVVAIAISMGNQYFKSVKQHFDQ
ncbi:oligosaccharide flippase family protein [Flavobacteriales bacterium AH-315-E23]|nr:oligosaccharide flippase family protein [Flavobacteriales bacterium AH-315-E23]